MARSLAQTGPIIAAALLCACTPQPSSKMNALDARIDNVAASVADLRNAIAEPAYSPGEQGRIERECVEARRAEARRADPNGLSCDFGSLEDARLWETQHRGRKR